MSKIIMTLDLSTKSTGWAVFQKNNSDLIAYGVIKPAKIPGISKMVYPESSFERIMSMSDQLKDLVSEHDPDELWIEEVNRGVNRISQKSLDALHFFVLDRLKLIDPTWVRHVNYIDSNGRNGWRGKLGLRLSLEDKAHNKIIRAKNKKNPLKLRVIDWKTLAARYANEYFGLELDVNARTTDADIADAICIGLAVLKK